jgi:hypothetical protein
MSLRLGSLPVSWKPKIRPRCFRSSCSTPSESGGVRPDGKRRAPKSKRAGGESQVQDAPLRPESRYRRVETGEGRRAGFTISPRPTEGSSRRGLSRHQLGVAATQW